jgi:hypothetical protein
VTDELRFTSGSVFREEPEGGILFDVNTGRLKLVEGVAWGICHLIDRGATRETLLRELASRYPNEESLVSDLDSFLAELTSEGFLPDGEHGANPACS